MKTTLKQDLAEQIPYGYNSIIAQKAGVTTQTVSNFFADKNNSVKVELAAMEVIAELNEKRKALIERLK